MKRNFPRITKKCILSLAAVAVFTVSTTVAAETSILDRLVGTGRLTYDADGDGVAEVVYDQSDLVNIAYQLKANEAHLGQVSERLSEVSKTEGENAKKVVDAYNSLAFEDLPAGSSYTDVADAILALTSPTKVLLSYAQGTGTPTSVKPDANDQRDIAITLKQANYVVSLGIDQKFTLPAGYYSKPITIKNAIANRSNKVPVTVNDGQPTPEMAEGYYPQFTATSTVKPKATYTFKLYHHVHSTSSNEQTVYNTDFSTNINGLSGQSGYTAFADNTFQTTKGGCYTVPLYHAHSQWSKDATTSQPGVYEQTSLTYGGCYTEPVYHVHTADCYRWKIEYATKSNIANKYQTTSVEQNAKNMAKAAGVSFNGSLTEVRRFDENNPTDPMTLTTEYYPQYYPKDSNYNEFGRYDYHRRFISDYKSSTTANNGKLVSFNYYNMKHCDKSAYKNFVDADGLHQKGNEWVSGYTAFNTDTYTNKVDRWVDGGFSSYTISWAEDDEHRCCGKTLQTIECYRCNCGKRTDQVYYGLGCGRLRGEVVAGEVTRN